MRGLHGELLRVAALRAAVRADDSEIGAVGFMAVRAGRAGAAAEARTHRDASAVYLARDIGAEDVRRLDLRAGEALSDPEVEVVERARAHAQENFAGARHGIGNGLDREVFNSAERLEDNRFHAVILLT